MKRFDYQTWDVFTQHRFAGNPLAVVWQGDTLDTLSMQRIAREFNYSETVFVCSPSSETATAALRIFTPAMELPFAGHPAIGAAIALKAAGHIDGAQAVLEVSAGTVYLTFEHIGASVLARLSPPVQPQILKRDVYDLGPVTALDGRAEIFHATAGTVFAILPLKTKEDVDGASQGPQMAALLRECGSAGLYIVCEDGAGRLYARLLADEIGLSEDPATGSAAAALAAVLADKGSSAGDYVIQQGVQMGRPSEIYLSLKPGGDCTVGGYAVQVMAGQMETA